MSVATVLFGDLVLRRWEHSWGNGASRPSDTTESRLLEADFAEANVEFRSTGYLDFEVVREDRDVLDEFLDERSAFGFGGVVPYLVDVEGLQYLDEFGEALGYLVVG